MRSQTGEANKSANLSSKAAEQAALGVLVKMSARKRLFIRVLEFVARPLVVGLEHLLHRQRKIVGEVKKILVIEYWNLGDLVMEVPFLRSLRIQYPDAHITLLASPKVAPLVEHQGLVDKVIVVRVPWTEHYSRWRKYNPFSVLWIELLRSVRFLRTQEIDLGFSARADFRDNFILWFAKVGRRVGYAFGGGGFFLSDVVTPDVQQPHFSNRWLRLLDAVGRSPIVREPRLQVTPEEQRCAETCLAEHGIGNGEFLVGIHPGARSRMRQWGEENFVALAKRLQKEFPIKFIWFRDPGQTVGTQDNIQATSVSLPLRRFMGVLAQCDMLICNDSGPMHIATALEVPVVAVFGPTEPAWFGPLGQHNRIVIQPGFWCRPCFDYCLFDEPYCLRTITVDSVFAAAVEALSLVFAKGREPGGGIEQGTLNAARPE
ncbi:MAG: glycosyltransferase family 9 protein [Candidatus Acidiferrum sp.]